MLIGAVSYIDKYNDRGVMNTMARNSDLRKFKSFRAEILPGTKTGLNAPAGYPTLKTLQFEAELKAADVKLFNQKSERDSIVLTVKSNNDISENLTVTFFLSFFYKNNNNNNIILN